MWTVHITLCAVELQWHKMYRKFPQHPSSSLLTTAAEEKQTFHRLLFLFFFGLFNPWYECICDSFDFRICCDSRAGIFKWNFDDFLWETVSDMKESRLTCGSCAQLMCSILLDLPLSVICICIKCPNSFKTSLHNNFSNNLFHMKSDINFMQFSTSACESYTLQSPLLDCNGIKCTGNDLNIPAAAFSQQL